MRFLKRAITVSAATLTLAGLTACGAVGTAVDCNAAGNEATKIMQEWTGSLSAGMTDPKAMEKASNTAAEKSKALAAKYDGEIAAALNDLAAGFESIKDLKDASKLTEFTGKMQGFSTKIQSACT
ncbi:hypothetical protein AB0B45_07855 [Nonomuraea sp. NPDC049152]|uniref:hypothetical protein n=1 Tax=Nonomuraea sp. NPDC049152 TaxID=3154350 RepID=UPI0033F501F8